MGFCRRNDWLRPPDPGIDLFAISIGGLAMGKPSMPFALWGIFHVTLAEISRIHGQYDASHG